MKTKLQIAAAVVVCGVLLSLHVKDATPRSRRQVGAPMCAPADDPNASAVLNCMTLVPVPDLPTAQAVIHLRPVASPFGVAVTVDGRPRYKLVATVAGLPEPKTLGAFSTYVA